MTSINPGTNATYIVQYSITKTSGITIGKNDTANLNELNNISDMTINQQTKIRIAGFSREIYTHKY